MKKTMALLACMILLPFLPGAQAQEPDAWVEDDEGDETFTIFPVDSMAAPVDRWGAYDLVSLQMHELPEDIHFAIQVADLSEQPGQTLYESGSYEIRFNHGDVPYAVAISRFIDIDATVRYSASLYQIEESDFGWYGTHMASMKPQVDVEADTISVDVPRDRMPDQKGAEPIPGRHLEDLFVKAAGSRANILCCPTGDPLLGTRVDDRMPDEGYAPPFPIQLGVTQSGDAALASKDPMRISNGGATTIVYQVQASNHGDARASYALSLHDVPASWEVQLPFDRFSIDGGETTSFPVLLTTSSGHKHGGSEAFRVEMRDRADAGNVGRVELGLRYTDIPQPAGHHPTLYFHSYKEYEYTFDEVEELITGRTPGLRPYMNAASDDPSDMGQPVAGYGFNFIGEGETYWELPLRPGLGMGLDFDIKDVGAISVPIATDFPITGATVEASLYYLSGDDETWLEIGRVDPADPVDMDRGEEVTFTGTLVPDEDADFLPYVKGSRLVLVIHLEGTFTNPMLLADSGPVLNPGGFIELPLNEYRDPVDTFYEHVASLQFEDSFLERAMNPGKTLVFEVDLHNAGDVKEDVVLNVTGNNQEWARIVGDREFSLAPGQERTVAVAVKIPSDAPDGALADLVLQAASKQDPNRRAVLSLVALVDSEDSYADESSKVSSLEESLSADKKSPGFEIAAFLAILAGMVAVLPRRRS